MDQLAIYFLDAANYVLILVLVALGLAIVFGLMGVINMAHGEFMMLGAYAVMVTDRHGGSYWLGLLLAPLAVGVVGFLIEEAVIRRIYARVLDTILASWGISLMLKQGIVLIFGPGSYSMATPIAGNVLVFGAPYPVFRLFIMGVSLAAVAFTFWMFFATRFGLAARAVIANRAMAGCLGINTRRLDRLTFTYGAMLAGLAGAVMAPLISLDPQMGLGFLVPAFLSILVGGLGSILGPLAGAATVGVTDNLIATLYSPVWAQLVVFAVVVVLIRLFPSGLAARRRREL